MPNIGTSPDGNYVQYDGSINVGGDRNWRNNNPGNIEAGTFADSQGAIGSDGRFAIFPDPETGMRALQSLLTSDSYQGLTIEQAMERYAPPSENNTDAYTSFITEQVGVDPSTPMSDLTADQLASFGNAIETYEGGTAGTTYQAGDASAPSWVQDVFGGSAPDDPDPTTDPTSSPTPDPVPDPPSDPIPTPLPDPVPDPTPGPSPDPTPDPPDPAPVDPTPDPTPDPSPGPDPSPDPGSGSGGDGPGDPGAGGDGGGGGEGGGEGGGGGGGEGGAGGEGD